VFVHVPVVVFHEEDGYMGIVEWLAAGWAEDNHYQVEVAEDIHRLEAVGEGNRVIYRFRPA